MMARLIACTTQDIHHAGDLFDFGYWTTRIHCDEQYVRLLVELLDIVGEQREVQALMERFQDIRNSH